MQRSMVHQLNGLASSQFMNNRSTFISTAFNEGDHELKKSRIQNLPSYRKEDMSNKINFIVVFQSIEIQRLSNEVQALRVALKDAERQNFNMHNYEVQIRELTEKCFAYEREREEYRDEIDKLNMICEKLYEQLETMKVRFADIDPTIKQKYKLERDRSQKLQQQLQKWKARYSAMESSKTREMEDMRLMMESQRKSMMDRQIKELTLRFGSQRQNLQKQIRKLREGVESRDIQLQRVHGRISQLQILNQELRQYENTIDQYEQKFAMITQETMRLNDVIRNKNEQIQRLSSGEANYRKKIGDLERRLREAEEGGEKARALDNQIRQWKTRYSRVEQQNKEYKHELDKIPQFKQVIQQINNESERLKDAVKQKMRQIDDWKGRCQNVQIQLKQNKAQQQQKIPQLESKLSQLGGENDRLNNALKTRAAEIQNWRNKHSEIERQITRYVQIQSDKKNLENQLNNHVRQINDLQGSIRQLQGQTKRLGEVQRELNQERLEKQECRKQLERLNGAVRSATDKVNDYQRKCANLQRDLKSFTQIQQELRVYKQKQINLTKQIDRINGIITEKIKQIQALKETFLKFENRIGQYQNIEKKLIESVNQTQKLIQDLDQSRKENGFLQDKLLQGDMQNKKMKNDIFVLSQQKEQVVRLVNSRTQELDQAKGQLAQLQNLVSQLRQKQARLREVEELIRVNENKLGEVERKYKSEQNRSRELNNSLEQINSELTKIKREGMMSPKFKEQFYELRVQTEQRQRQIRSLQQRISTIQNIIKKLKQVVIRQDQLARRNHQKFGTVSKQFESSAQAMKKMFELQNQVMKLNEQNMQLEGKVRIMGVQNESFKKSFDNNSGNAWNFQIERDIKYSSPVGSPIGAITSKKVESKSSYEQNYETSFPKTSSNYTNMVVSNVRPANNPQGLLSPTNAMNMGFGNSSFGFPPTNSGASSRAETTYTTETYSSKPKLTTTQSNSSSSNTSNFQFRTSSRQF